MYEIFCRIENEKMLFIYYKKSFWQKWCCFKYKIVEIDYQVANII